MGGRDSAEVEREAGAGYAGAGKNAGVAGGGEGSGCS